MLSFARYFIEIRKYVAFPSTVYHKHISDLIFHSEILSYLHRVQLNNLSTYNWSEHYLPQGIRSRRNTYRKLSLGLYHEQMFECKMATIALSVWSNNWSNVQENKKCNIVQCKKIKYWK